MERDQAWLRGEREDRLGDILDEFVCRTSVRKAHGHNRGSVAAARTGRYLADRARSILEMGHYCLRPRRRNIKPPQIHGRRKGRDVLCLVKIEIFRVPRYGDVPPATQEARQAYAL